MLYYIIGRRDTGRGVAQCAAARRRRVSPEKLLSSGRECVGQKNKKRIKYGVWGVGCVSEKRILLRIPPERKVVIQ